MTGYNLGKRSPRRMKDLAQKLGDFALQHTSVVRQKNEIQRLVTDGKDFDDAVETVVEEMGLIPVFDAAFFSTVMDEEFGISMTQFQAVHFLKRYFETEWEGVFVRMPPPNPWRRLVWVANGWAIEDGKPPDSVN